jgi:ketol-acid reductoisomerase
MVKIYYEKDASLDVLKDKTLAVIGYGSQGHAQALNMKDSGLKVICGLRPGGESWKKAEKDGLEVVRVEEAAERADILFLLIPDIAQKEVYEKQVEPNLGRGKALCFAHGFNVHFGVIKPRKDLDVFMVAPKSPGLNLRSTYLKGFGVPSLVAVYQDRSGKALKMALGIAKAIGSTRVGVLETTFQEEAESDLIGEQCVLVGGLMELIKMGYEVQRELGYSAEMAYFECLNEAKLIMDLIYERGITGMLYGVSDTAKHGGLFVGPKIIDGHVRENMLRAAEMVRDGSYAKKCIEDCRKRTEMQKLLDETENLEIERIGRKLREMMGFK